MCAYAVLFLVIVLPHITLTLAVASPGMGNWGTCSPRLPTISVLVHFRVNLTANYTSIV